ncbi:MAG: hypothetical protein U9N61_02115 [Euryarchaeota archaeon]|nr:hypothetical protein [Euryarchaeota archaeon]
MAELDIAIKLAVLRQLGTIPRIKGGERDEWRYLIRGWCQTQRVPEVCGKDKEVVNWLMANPGWQPPQFYGYETYPEEMRYMPEEIEVTARSLIPLWYCNERNCYKIPCKVDNPFGATFSIHDGRYDESEFGLGTPPDIIYLPVHKCGRITREIPKEWEANSGLYVTKERGIAPYTGNVNTDLCALGKLHITIIHYPKQIIHIQKHVADSPW